MESQQVSHQRIKEIVDLQEHTLKITMETFFLHEYFLFYSPVLIAASSIWACMTLVEHKELQGEIYGVFKGQILNKGGLDQAE